VRARPPSTAALVLVTGVGPFATDTYLAALPQVQRSLATTAGVAQLTITAFIVGVAVGQLALGPVSDGRGRRTLLLAASVTYALTSVLCAFAPSGPVLVGVRLVQGIAAGGGVAIGRAVVSDHYHGPEAAVRFATLASVTFLGPVLAPSLGGVLLAFGSWRLVFVALAVMGVAMVAAVWWGVPETLPPEQRHGGGLGHTGSRVADLLRDRVFGYHVVVQCLATAGFFTYIGGSSFVLQTVYGISQGRFAVVFAVNAAAMVVTSTVGRFLVRRTGPAPLRRVGVALSTTASVGLLAVALTGSGAGSSIGWPWLLLCLVVAGMGLTIPASTVLAQEAGRRSGGTASALQGGIVFLVGAAATPLTGFVGYDSLLPMAACMAGFFAVALALLVVPLVRRRRPA
jgi:MFS transporter, DHA1 family, multidrug resistance protein